MTRTDKARGTSFQNISSNDDPAKHIMSEITSVESTPRLCTARATPPSAIPPGRLQSLDANRGLIMPRCSPAEFSTRRKDVGLGTIHETKHHDKKSSNLIIYPEFGSSG